MHKPKQKTPLLSALQKIINFNRISQQSSLQGELARIFENPDNILNKILDLINIAQSMVCVTYYIGFTYYENFFKGFLFGYLNFFMHLYFFAEWMLRLFAQKNRKKYFFSSESLVDMLSTIPFFFSLILSFNLVSTYTQEKYVQFSNLLNLLRILRIQRLIHYIKNDVNKQLLEIILSVITLLVVSGATIQFIEKLKDPDDLKTDLEKEIYNYELNYYLYFVMTTISTVGYENHFTDPRTQILIIVLLWFAIYFVPTKSSQLMTLLSSKSVYSRRSYKATQSIPHVVITGVVSHTAAQDFFSELFHEDHGSQKKHAVILVPHQPDNQMEALISNRKQDIIYLEGDPLKEKDLNRCQIDKAKAIIILCNKQSADQHEEDAKTILQAMHIKKLLKKQIRFCMQLLRHEGKMHYYLSLTKSTKNDQVICIEELKMSLLAKSCLCPGLITVISNLITSSEEPNKKEIEYEWLEDYWHGQGYEIYRTNLTTKFNGYTFQEASLTIYMQFQAIMFGVEIIHQDNSEIYLNPSNLTLSFKRGEKIYGYIISQDKKVSDDIANFQLSEEEKIAQQRYRKSIISKKRRRGKHFELKHQSILQQQQQQNSHNNIMNNDTEDTEKLTKKPWQRSFNNSNNLDNNNNNNNNDDDDDAQSQYSGIRRQKKLSSFKLNNNKRNQKKKQQQVQREDSEVILDLDRKKDNTGMSVLDLRKMLKKDSKDFVDEAFRDLCQQEFDINDQDFYYNNNNNNSNNNNNNDEIDQQGDGDEDEDYEEEEDDDEDDEEDDDYLNMGNKQENFKSILNGEITKISEQCYITKDKINLRDVTFQTLKNNILAKDHIILCGLCHNLLNFMIPLRSKYLSKYPTIVILNEEPPTEKQWNQIAFFPEIYFVKGSALLDKDLQRANIMQAKQVVILTPNINQLRDINAQKPMENNPMEMSDKNCSENTQNPRQLSKEEEDLLDARTVFKYKAVQRIKPDVNIITELVKPSNFAFLLSSSEDYSLMRNYGYNNTPLFASGEVYLSSVMDSLCCQAFYNNALITVLNLLLLGSGPQFSNSRKKPSNGGGGSGNQQENQIVNSNLFQIPVPRYFQNHSFQSLFGYLSKRRKIIALGIYRGANCKDNKYPYVWTNPKPETILTKKDLILVLTQKKPGPEVIDWGGPLEVKTEIPLVDTFQSSTHKEQFHNSIPGPNDDGQQDQQFQQQQQQQTSKSQDGYNNNNNNMQLGAIKNYQNSERENIKQNQNQNELELLKGRIQNIIAEMNFLRHETDQLHNQLNKREGKLLEDIRCIFNSELQQLIMKKSQGSKTDINTDIDQSDNNIYDSQNYINNNNNVNQNNAISNNEDNNNNSPQLQQFNILSDFNNNNNNNNNFNSKINGNSNVKI